MIPFRKKIYFLIDAIQIDYFNSFVYKYKLSNSSHDDKDLELIKNYLIIDK